MSKIVDTLIKDIIINSIDKPYLAFSENVFNSLMELKEWNFKNIYQSKEANKNHEIIEELFSEIYDVYLNEDIGTKREIIDYIAGQTDKFFLKECEENIKGFKLKDLHE